MERVQVNVNQLCGYGGAGRCGLKPVCSLLLPRCPGVGELLRVLTAPGEARVFRVLEVAHVLTGRPFVPDPADTVTLAEPQLVGVNWSSYDVLVAEIAAGWGPPPAPAPVQKDLAASWGPEK